jgi:two-component system LytT family response regulator
VKAKVLIVDDEPLARSRLRKFLVQEPNIEILGECGNGPEAISFIRNNAPDVVFLDVQMPEVSGFDVLKALPPEKLPVIVFVTAFDHHAIEAFEVHALDYLLKPFTRARLRDAVEHALQHLEHLGASAGNRQLMDWVKAPKAEPVYLSRFAVKTSNQIVLVNVEDVDYIESASNYLVLHTRTENHIVRETLARLETRLSPRLFLRISRSVIVNLSRVKRLQSHPGGECVAVLQNDRELPITRGIREVQERLQYPTASEMPAFTA